MGEGLGAEGEQWLTIMHTVHLRITDSSTGKPTPARIQIRTGSMVRIPFGRLAHFSIAPGEDVGGNVLLDGQPFTYIDGACEVQLPPGEVTVQVSKGPEYRSAIQTVTLGQGKISLRLEIERWTDERTQGWYSGDVRAHDLSPHAAQLEGAAEGLALVEVLARERPRGLSEDNEGRTRPGAYPNLLAFSGARCALESSECRVAVNTLNVHPVLGTVALLHSHRPVYPLRFGAPDGCEDWSVTDWCDQCQRKTGLVVWPDFPRMCAESLQGEALAALLLGKVDAFEIASFTGEPRGGLAPTHPPGEGDLPASLLDWYRLLDVGLRIPLVGASGKDSNARALGCLRTYARVEGEDFDLNRWIEAVRAGRTFITAGPLVKLQVGEQEPGGCATVPAGTRIPIRAEAKSATPKDSRCARNERLEVLVNGEVVQSQPSPGGEEDTVLVEMEHPVQAGCWIAARVVGKGASAFAHTTPVFVQVQGQSFPRKAQSVNELREVLDRTAEWIREKGQCDREKPLVYLQEILSEARTLLDAGAEVD